MNESWRDPAKAVFHRIVGNLGSNGFGLGVRVLSQLALVPVFISAWGKEAYGDWLVLSALPVALLALDLGFHPAAGNAMTLAAARGDWNRARSIWWSLAFLSALVFAAVFVLGAILSKFQIAYDLLHIKGGHNGTVAVTALCFVVYTWVTLQQLGVAFALQAGGYSARGLAWVYGINLAETLLTMAIVWTTSSMAVIALSQLGLKLIGLIWSYTDACRKVRCFSPTTFQIDWNDIKSLGRPALAFASFPVGQFFLLSGMTWVVNAVLGSGAVVIFSTTRTLARALTQGIALVNASVGPEYTRLIGASNFAGTRRLHRLALRVALIACGLGFVGLIIFGPWILRMWTRGQVTANMGVLICLSMSAVGSAIWTTNAMPLRASNSLGSLARWYVCAAAVAWLVAFPLASYIGLIGVALAMLIVDVILVPWTLHQACILTGDKERLALFDLSTWRELRGLKPGSD